MRVLVCGSRDGFDRKKVFDTLDDIHKKVGIDVVIEGDQRGVDQIAGAWAKQRRIDLKPYPAKWKLYGKPAGPIRNQQMLDEGKPDLVVAFPGGPGTACMIGLARAYGIEVYQPFSD